MTSLSRSEFRLLLGVLLMVAIAALAPSMAQPQAYHHFADARTMWGVHRAMDSLSNIGFLALGVYGLVLSLQGRLEFFCASMKGSVTTFFVGMVATAVGSTYYHLAPDDAGLVVDRLGMVIVFAGVLGMAGAHRISDRAGWAMLVLGLVAGPGSLAWWLHSGSITPYGVVQFGGIALACAAMAAPARGVGPHWAGLLLTYTLAKLFEQYDIAIFDLTHHMVSGHTLKHFAAALPVLAVTRGLMRKPTSGTVAGGQK